MDLDYRGLLTQVANHAAEDCFVPRFKREDNLRERQLDGLGIRISQWTKWDGIEVMKILSFALHDANYHHEASAVCKLIDEVQGM